VQRTRLALFLAEIFLDEKDLSLLLPVKRVGGGSGDFPARWAELLSYAKILHQLGQAEDIAKSKSVRTSVFLVVYSVIIGNGYWLLVIFVIFFVTGKCSTGRG
jgi:hypothetical protein